MNLSVNGGRYIFKKQDETVCFSILRKVRRNSLFEFRQKSDETICLHFAKIMMKQFVYTLAKVTMKKKNDK